MLGIEIRGILKADCNVVVRGIICEGLDTRIRTTTVQHFENNDIHNDVVICSRSKSNSSKVKCHPPCSAADGVPEISPSRNVSDALPCYARTVP